MDGNITRAKLDDTFDAAIINASYAPDSEEELYESQAGQGMGCWYEFRS